MMMRRELWSVGRNTVTSSEGWSVSLLDEQTLEYTNGAASCVVNVDYSPGDQARRIHATESVSPLFPRLCEHLSRAAQMLKGRYVVD
jgi:hypothetical protein